MKIILLYIMGDFDAEDDLGRTENIQLNVLRRDPVPEVPTIPQVEPSFPETSLNQIADFETEGAEIEAFYRWVKSKGYVINEKIKEKKTKNCLNELINT